MIKDRFILNQLANAGNKTVYELILEAPYSAGVKPSDISTALAGKTPSDIALNSKAKYVTEDANGNRVVWEFTYQQTAVSEYGWVITRVLEGGVAPVPLEVTENAKYEGNGATAYTPVDVDVPQPSGKITITENGENINISSYATADVNVSGGGDSDLVEMEATAYNYAITLNKSYNDIVAYHNQGKIPYFSLTQAELESAYLDEHFAGDVKYGAVYHNAGNDSWIVQFVALGVVADGGMVRCEAEAFDGADVPFVIDFGG